MRIKRTGLLTGVTLFGLAFIVIACSFPTTSVEPDITATYIQGSILFTQTMEVSPPSLTPTVENTQTPSPTLDPYFLSLTPPASPTFFVPTTEPRPAYYTLQSGEFPYCVARRFDVDPKELLALNNLNSGLIYAPGLVLTIPQSGHPFPALRTLNPHPTTYTVPAQMTVYKVACYFGDVDPMAIMHANGLTSPILTMGMTLHIP